MMRSIGMALCVVVCVSLAVGETVETQVYDVPKLEGVTIDGRPDDWGDVGFRIDILNPAQGEMPSLDDGDVQARLAWCDEGLLVWLHIRDDEAVETSNDQYWPADSVEFFLSKAKGLGEHVQWLASPGMAKDQPALRSRTVDKRLPATKEHAPSADGTFARKKVEGGYTLEALLPWASMVKPVKGSEARFQFYVNDRDADGKMTFVWHPSHGTHQTRDRTFGIRLAESASPAFRIVATGGYEKLRKTRIQVRGTADLAGKMVVARAGKQVLGKGLLHASDGRSSGEIIAPMPPIGKGFGWVDIEIEGESVAVMRLPDADEMRAKALMNLSIRSEGGYAFSGPKFPELRFSDPGLARAIMGKCRIEVDFYNAEFEKVTQAEKPGRYGAVIRMIDEEGRPHTRYRTFFRFGKPFKWWNTKLTGELVLPEAMGISPEVVKSRQDDVLQMTKWSIAVANAEESILASTLAGLSELDAAGRAGEKATVFNSPAALDRDWWVKLKRKLNGNAKRYPKPFVCPVAKKGTPTRVLRMGTEAEAGFKPGTKKAIEAVLEAWEKDTDTPFIACVARNGVAIINQAYGTKPDGSPNDVHHATWMASATKFMQGTLMMMFVDQGLIDLEAPIGTYIPELRNVKFSRPVTVRDLIVHTAGMWGHWGDDEADLEAKVADYGPYFEVGKRFSYNGMDMAVASKAMEQIAGRCLPMLYKEHLVDPLGMSDTGVTNSSYDAQSTAWDMACMGQMIANGGAYGKHRFFSEATLEKRLPRPLIPQLGPGGTKEAGIGCYWMHEPLGKRTIFHNAASNATICVDLDNDVVVSMSRPTAGKNFHKYHKQFMLAVREGIANPKNLTELKPQK